MLVILMLELSLLTTMASSGDFAAEKIGEPSKKHTTTSTRIIVCIAVTFRPRDKHTVRERWGTGALVRWAEQRPLIHQVLVKLSFVA